MNLHQWLRTFLAHTNCSVVVLDAIWICTALHPRATKAYIMDSLNAVPDPGGALLINLPTARKWTYFNLCSEIPPHDHSHCVCLLNNSKKVMSQIKTQFHDSQNLVHGPYGYFQPSNSGQLLHPGVWLQQVVDFALTNSKEN